MIPIQNEIMSVRDVMVMETAASERVFAILISTLDLGEVRLHAANITNVSSIPIPVNIERTRELCIMIIITPANYHVALLHVCVVEWIFH